MSLILEALNRSNQERQADANSPGLDTPAYVDELEEGRGWRSWLPWAVALFALLGISVLLVDKYKGQGEQPQTSLAGVPDREQASALVHSQVQIQETSMALGASLKNPKPVNTQSIPPTTTTVNSEKPAPPQPVLSDPAVENLYTGQTPVQKKLSVAGIKEIPAERTESAIDIEQVLKDTEEALKTSRLGEHSAPFINGVSQQFKDDIPTIMYRHHDYSSQPGESSVILNGKTVRSGGKVSGGVKVVEILPGSVVLSFGGQQFRLRALNSWVNF